MLLAAAEPRYGKEILGKRVKLQTADGKRWRTATVSGYHGGYLRHTGKWRACTLQPLWCSYLHHTRLPVGSMTVQKT